MIYYTVQKQCFYLWASRIRKKRTNERMKRIILLTGSELRHDFFRISLGNNAGFTVVKSYCESQDANLNSIVEAQADNSLRQQHLQQREQTEKEFFEQFCKETPDHSNPEYLEKGDINLEQRVEEIRLLNPDLLIAYGCSIIQPELIAFFEGRFINVHLGLSPYYRGSGTNFWPFVNNEPEYVGVSFMYIDAGIDTGRIFHQLRARIEAGDTIHTIGNRLISDFVQLLPRIIEHFDQLEEAPQITIPKDEEKYYRNRDFTEASLKQAYANASNGMIADYLENRENRTRKVKIVTNPVLTGNTL